MTSEPIEYPSEADAVVGDLPPEQVRAALHQAADLAADYLTGVERYRVLPPTRPGEVRRQLPPAAPEEGEPLDAILADVQSLILPHTTHWNHPGFMAYFAITGSGPGVIGELLAAALNVNAMLWRTGPAATELEELTCDWLRQGLGLPAEFRGHINDTASVSTFVALAAARHRVGGAHIRARGLSGADQPSLTVYASEHAHSSVDKACVALGLGLEHLRKIPADEAFRMRPDALAAAIDADHAAGRAPIAVVATVGTTSTASVDPVPAIADIAQRHGLWLHVDAAYAGAAALAPELRALMPGLERSDSLVTNPHKWLFVPVDCSTLFVRDSAELRDAFSIVPDYLQTPETDVTNLMDYGVQLGRRFRALKLWMVLRAFGLEGLRARVRAHCALAREFADWIDADERFARAAPAAFSTVCFRATPDLPPDEQDRLNERLLAAVNAAGPVLLSHTRLGGRYVLRLTIGNLRTERRHVQLAQQLLDEAWRRVQD